MSALGLGHVITVLTQLLLPPAFLAVYGMERYGEWLVLSAAVGYLGALDFGLQTYTTNELTILYHRGERQRFHQLQSVGLWLTLGLILAGTVLALLAFILPVELWLKIAWSHGQTAQVLFWLALQLLASIAMGNLNGLYRVVSQAHRAAMWGNCSKILSLTVTLAAVGLGSALQHIALLQFLVLLVCIGFILVDLSRVCPAISPSLRYWNRALAVGVLKPSFFFAFFVLNNFLIFQAPLLLLNRFFGPATVVTFTIGRSLFSFVRQVVAMFQHSLAPEITRLYGFGDTPKLARVLTLVETLVLTTSLVAGVGMLVLSPQVLKVWLGRPELFDFWLYLLLMLVTTVMNLKDCKLYLQYFTNNHIAAALLSTGSYLAVLWVCWYLVPISGPLGFMAAWLVVESAQLAWAHLFNIRLLAGARGRDFRSLIRLSLVLMATTVALYLSRPFLTDQAALVQGLGALVAMGAVSFVCYFMFNLSGIISECKTQWQRV